MEDITLIHGDCLEVLPTLADNSVEAIVTDPPWGLGFKYGTTKDVTKFSPSEYWNWFRPRYLEMFRILKLGGLMAIWQSHQYFKYL